MAWFVADRGISRAGWAELWPWNWRGGREDGVGEVASVNVTLAVKGEKLMSVLGYFEKRRPARRMTGGLTIPGVSCEGQVLSGKLSPEEAQGIDAQRAVHAPYVNPFAIQDGVVRAQRPVYGSTKDYDPVLKSHCRF